MKGGSGLLLRPFPPAIAGAKAAPEAQLREHAGAPARPPVRLSTWRASRPILPRPVLSIPMTLPPTIASRNEKAAK